MRRIIDYILITYLRLPWDVVSVACSTIVTVSSAAEPGFVSDDLALADDVIPTHKNSLFVQMQNKIQQQIVSEILLSFLVRNNSYIQGPSEVQKC